MPAALKSWAGTRKRGETWRKLVANVSRTRRISRTGRTASSRQYRPGIRRAARKDRIGTLGPAGRSSARHFSRSSRLDGRPPYLDRFDFARELEEQFRPQAALLRERDVRIGVRAPASFLPRWMTRAVFRDFRSTGIGSRTRCFRIWLAGRSRAKAPARSSSMPLRSAWRSSWSRRACCSSSGTSRAKRGRTGCGRTSSAACRTN